MSETMPRKVLEGEQGWLYLDNDKNDSVGQYTGATRLSATAQAAWSGMLAGITALAAETGFRHVQLLAPSKESVYDDWYPHRAARAAERPTETLLAAVPPGAQLIYPVAELKAAPRMRVYDKGDTHWNDYGAFVAAKVTLASTGHAEALDEAAYEFREAPSSGDLDSKLEPRRREPRITAHPRGPQPQLLFDSELKNRGRTLVYSNPAAPHGSMLLFGDSFGWNLALFFGQVFRRFVFIHSTSPDRSVIQHERPDVVVTECTERFVVEGPARLGRFAIGDMARSKFRKAPPEERAQLHALYRTKSEQSSERHYAEIFLGAVTE